MTAFWALVRRELRAVSRERTIVIAIVIQLFIASFSSAILVGLVSYYDPESIAANARVRLRVGLVGDAASPLVGYLREGRARVFAFDSPQQAEAAYHTGLLDVIVAVPRDTLGVVDIKLLLPAAESRATVALMVLKEPLRRFEDSLRAARGVALRYADVRGAQPTTYEFLYSTIIPILLFFPAFVAGSMTVDSIAEEHQSKTLDTLWAAPVSLQMIYGSKVVAVLALAAVQCVLWMVLLRLNGILLYQPVLAFALAVVVASLNALGSALVALTLRDRERAQFLYSLLLLIVLGVGQLAQVSPIALLTRLTTGDPYAGALQVGGYAIAALVALEAFLLVCRKQG